MKTKTLIAILLMAGVGLAIVAGSFLLRTSSEIEQKTEQQADRLKPEKEALRSFLPADDNRTNATGMLPVDAGANCTDTVPAARSDRDRVVTTTFLNDLAGVVVDNYHPAGSRLNPTSNGMSTLSLKSLNTRYGIELIGLRHRSATLDDARREVLDHLFSPQVISVLYITYKQPFLTALLQEAQNATKDFQHQSEDGFVARPLTDAQVRELFILHAPLLRQTGLALDALVNAPDLPEAVQRLLTLEQAAMLANDQYNRARYEFQELRNDQTQSELFDAGDDLRRAGVAMEEAAQSYKTAIKAREEAKQEVLAGIRPLELGLLSDYDTLYLAKWVSRRIDAQGQSRAALAEAASVLKDLGDSFEETAREL